MTRPAIALLLLSCSAPPDPSNLVPGDDAAPGDGAAQADAGDDVDPGSVGHGHDGTPGAELAAELPDAAVDASAADAYVGVCSIPGHYCPADAGGDAWRSKLDGGSPIACPDGQRCRVDLPREANDCCCLIDGDPYFPAGESGYTCTAYVNCLQPDGTSRCLY